MLSDVCVYKLLQSQLLVGFDGTPGLIAQCFPVSRLQRRASQGLPQKEVSHDNEIAGTVGVTKTASRSLRYCSNFYLETEVSIRTRSRWQEVHRALQRKVATPTRLALTEKRMPANYDSSRLVTPRVPRRRLILCQESAVNRSARDHTRSYEKGFQHLNDGEMLSECCGVLPELSSALSCCREVIL